MVHFRDGRTAVKPSSLRLSKYTRSEQRRLQEDWEIVRTQLVNELDQGIGAVRLARDDRALPYDPALSYGDQPCLVFDLTDHTHNYTEDSEGGTPVEYLHTAKPLYILNFKSAQLANPFFRQLDVTYVVETFSMGNSTSISPGDRAVLDWIDFRGLFYGVKNRTTSWTIELCRLSNRLCPAPAVGLPQWDNTAANLHLNDPDLIARRNFWFEYINRETANPLLPQGVHLRDKGYKRIRRWRYNISEQTADEDALNSLQKKIFLKVNKFLNHRWRRNYLCPWADGDGATAAADNPAQFVQTFTSDKFISPSKRLFLIIKATAPKSIEEGADTKLKVQNGLQYPSYRSATLTAPMKPLVWNGSAFVEPADNSMFMGQGTSDLTSGPFGIDPNTGGTVPGPITIPPFFETVDAPDIGTHGGGDALLANSTVDNIQEVRGTYGMNINPAVIAAPTEVVTTVADPGGDLPTFDFVLRMKYRYASS